MEFESKMGLVAIRQNEIDVLAAIYDFGETYSKEIRTETDIGSKKLIQRSVKRIEKHELIKIVRIEGRKKVIRPTIQGIKRLDDEGLLEDSPFSEQNGITIEAFNDNRIKAD